MAFCFYNLSSIFNGLVYFDQFSVLSKKQIILLLVGIVILLAGVWIVSFPPTGGYSINIGAWTAAEDEDEDESVPLLQSGQTSPAELDFENSDDEQHDDEPLPQPSHSHSHPRRSRSEDIRMGAVASDQAGVLTESQSHRCWITEPPAPVTPPSSSTPVLPRARRPRTESEAERDASVHRSRSSYGAASPPPTFVGGASRRRRTTVAAPYSPPLANGSVPGQTALAGFSIGLSPVSPGFALVPTERRRRAMVGVVGSPEGIRRVVSEGGVARSRDVERIAGGDRVRGSDEGEMGRPEGRLSGTEGGKTRGRWKWLGSVFAFAGPGAR